MPDWSTLAVFVVLSLGLIIAPGPAVLYIVACSIEQGRAAGVVSALGVGVGSLFHVAAAVLGVSALLLSSALAFNAVKYLGAAYLIYLGVRTLLTRQKAGALEQRRSQRPLVRIFSQGVVVNLLNPKVALFFFAFLPQFIEPSRGWVAGQVLLLGSLFVALGIFSDSIYALLAGTARHWLRHSRAFVRGQRYLTGGIYIALGLSTAMAGAQTK